MVNTIEDTIRDILASAQRPGRKAGKLYTFKIPRRQPNRRRRRLHARVQMKIGRSIHPPRRKKQWERQCRGQVQEWLFYWDVPDASKFGKWCVFLEIADYTTTESLIHLHFKLTGAWVGRQPCDFCRVKHQEKFDYERCGGKWGIVRVVEYYLWRLNWPIRR